MFNFLRKTPKPDATVTGSYICLFSHCRKEERTPGPPPWGWQRYGTWSWYCPNH